MLIWPAEWTKHASTWMLWPARVDIWQDIEKAYRVYANIANTIVKYEPLTMIVNPDNLNTSHSYLDDQIEILSYPIDDSWARDVMPIFCLENGDLVAKNFDFNSWGGKFLPFQNDRQIKNIITKYKGWDSETINFVLEAGSVHSNGNGVLLTTQECLLNINRNPNLSKIDIEDYLKSVLNIRLFLWLPYGVIGDIDTDGHIDNIACFVNVNTILIQSCDDELDDSCERHKANMYYLNRYASDFDIIEIPQPKTKHINGEILAASYINFYIANDVVIMPSFNDVNDFKAYQIIKKCFPDRTVEQIEVLDLVAGGGGIHCITMQQPAI